MCLADRVGLANGASSGTVSGGLMDGEPKRVAESQQWEAGLGLLPQLDATLTAYAPEDDGKMVCDCEALQRLLHACGSALPPTDHPQRHHGRRHAPSRTARRTMRQEVVVVHVPSPPSPAPLLQLLPRHAPQLLPLLFPSRVAASWSHECPPSIQHRRRVAQGDIIA
jgi:hypothetical protein